MRVLSQPQPAATHLPDFAAGLVGEGGIFARAGNAKGSAAHPLPRVDLLQNLCQVIDCCIARNCISARVVQQQVLLTFPAATSVCQRWLVLFV